MYGEINGRDLLDNDMTKKRLISYCRICDKECETIKGKPSFCSMLCRFLSHTNITNTCWNWIGCTSDNNYGRFLDKGRLKRAHRISYELYKGSIPDDMEVCHSCDNTLCVNPSHLWIGTHTDNMRDAARKGKFYKLTQLSIG